MSSQQTEFQDKAKEIVNKLDCNLESGEKEKIIGLGKELTAMKDVDEKKDILNANVRTLEQQKMGDSEKTLKEFLETDIRSILARRRIEWSEKANSSNDYRAVQKFLDDIGKDLAVVCGTKKNDKIMGLQLYLNALNDLEGKHAKIPYDARNCKKDTEQRLFVDGYLGPHTFNALWLNLFGEELPKINLIRKPGYYFDRNEPRIIGKDLSYVALTLPGLDKTGNLKFQKSIEIIDNPKIKGAIELLYLFYDGVSQKENLKVDIDEELIKIMSDEKNINKGLDGYLMAIRDLNIKIAGKDKKLVKGCDLITKFINTGVNKESCEYNILYTLEYDVGAHEYVANYISSKYINLSKEPWKSKKDAIENSTTDKQFDKYRNKVNKQWLEQEKTQRKFILETLNNAKINAKSDAEKLALCEMFEVDSIDKVTTSLINDQVKKAIKLAESDFKTTMMDNYFRRRLLDSNIRIASKSAGELDASGKYIGKDRKKALFSDIQGIGYFNASSEHVDSAKFIAEMIAVEAACFAIGALSAGVGSLALRALFYGKRIGQIARLANALNRGQNIGRKISKLNKLKNAIRITKFAEKSVRAERALTWGGKAINATTFAAGLGLEGATFYEGSKLFQNIFDGKPTFEGWNDLPEIMKTIAMFGALKFVNKLVATKKLVTIGGKQININPFNTLATKNTDKIFTKVGKVAGESVVGGGTIFAVEGMGEAIIDTEYDWTKEEFIQAVLMYAIFRGAGEVGKLRISKNKKTGKPEIQKELPEHVEQKRLSQGQEQRALPKNIEQKTLPETKIVEGQKNRIKEIEAELKPINERLAELNKTGEYNMPEGQKLREQKSKLTVERDRLITDNKISKTKQEPVVETKPETSSRIKEIEAELAGQEYELSIVREKLKVAIEKGNTKLEKTLRDQVFYREQDIKFARAELNRLGVKEYSNVQKTSVEKESGLKPEENKPEEIKSPKENKKQSEHNQRLIEEQNEIQKLADDFDSQMMSDKGITINGKNCKLIYEPNMTQNNSRKGTWKFIEGEEVVSVKGERGILPENSDGNRIKLKYNELRGQYIKSFVGESKIVPIDRFSLLNWIKKNPIKTGLMAASLSGTIYIITKGSDDQGDETIKIEPVENLEELDPATKVITLVQDDMGEYHEDIN